MIDGLGTYMIHDNDNKEMYKDKNKEKRKEKGKSDTSEYRNVLGVQKFMQRGLMESLREAESMLQRSQLSQVLEYQHSSTTAELLRGLGSCEILGTLTVPKVDQKSVTRLALL
jgi:hypothetical protein